MRRLIRRRWKNRRHRQAHGKRRALARVQHSQPDGSAMQFDEVSHDGHPESQASSSAGGGGLLLLKAIKHVGKKIGGDAHTGVAHDQFHPGACGTQQDIDPAAGRRELDRVGEQVRRDLLEAYRISKNWR